ncbi:phosphodiester glycosidase family protein [Psychrobacter aestuarii]|uniref:Phosphodiester glycosidase family protein n=1 Tax=Psychrobacter aestuarii TaxID=556327 RepID=A0ABP3FCQ1_9GAMM|nr:phosphodiester glycosidase family protein [Psychrobacter aestuarii]
MYRFICFSLLSALGVSLSACNASSSDPVATDAEYWSCQKSEQPFAYSACHIDQRALADGRSALKLFWQQDSASTPLLTFDALSEQLPEDKTLAFAMNAGMYNKDYAPIGYTVIEGREIKSLNLKDGGGNFHLLPNGVLWSDKAGTVHIDESHVLKDKLDDGSAKPWYATQSGPMLVIDGKIHPKFDPNSSSRKIRNGVGICADNRLQWVVSDTPVTFYQFAELFKDSLQCEDALFLDGGIASAFYAPSIERHDKKQMGVMVGVVQPE